MTAPDPRLQASDLGFQSLADCPWPITWRYHVTGPFGASTQDLTVNAPLLAIAPDRAAELGPSLWSTTIARAMTVDCTLVMCEYLAWYGNPVPTVVPVSGLGGWRSGSSSRRDDSGQLVLCTGERDSRWRRRLFLPGIPPSWHAGGLLTRRGWEELLTIARALYMGLAALPPSILTNWLVAYPGALPFDFSNPLGVGFKRVTSVRVCWHVDRAPDPRPL